MSCLFHDDFDRHKPYPIVFCFLILSRGLATLFFTIFPLLLRVKGILCDSFRPHKLYAPIRDYLGFLNAVKDPFRPEDRSLVMGEALHSNV